MSLADSEYKFHVPNHGLDTLARQNSLRVTKQAMENGTCQLTKHERTRRKTGRISERVGTWQVGLITMRPVPTAKL